METAIYKAERAKAKSRLLQRLRYCKVDEQGNVEVGEFVDKVFNDPEAMKDLNTYLLPSPKTLLMHELFRKTSDMLYALQMHPNVTGEAFYKASFLSDQAISALKSYRPGKLRRLIALAVEEYQKLENQPHLS